ncbi:hypothetical protein [Candidatus Solirubrobacter pratensis]|nr:hypothetical protein [Candidatus Solirubrobacter pratensis]
MSAKQLVLQLAMIQGPIRDGRPIKPKGNAKQDFLGEKAVR